MKPKQIALFLIFSIGIFPMQAKDICVKVGNTLPHARHELVTMDAAMLRSKLGADNKAPLR